MSYIGTEPKDIRSFGRTQFDYTATQGQTAFTGADDDGKVLAFTVGQIEVYVNGILMDDSDFTTTGTGTVTLASAANLNDVINIVSFESNIPDNDYVPASGGTFSGTVAHTGDVTITGNANDANGNLKVTTNTPANYPAMVIETSTGGNSTEVHGLHIKNTAAGHGLRIDDESSDTTPVVVTSDGKVGVGLTTPDVKLYVKDSNSTPARLESTGASCYLQLINNNDGSGNFLGGETTNINLWTNNVKRLNIDGSGNMTLPYQPAFEAYVATGSGSTLSSGIRRFSDSAAFNAHVFTAINFNIGSHFNSSSSRFTAPVAGRYLMYGGMATNGSSASSLYMSFEFYISGTRKADGWNAKPGGYHKETTWRIFNLAANDYVEPGYENHSALSILSQGSTNNNYVYFGGYFLG